jgi:Heavy metal binding domain
MKVAQVVLLLVVTAICGTGGVVAPAAQSPAIYFCPMHPDVTDKAAGVCSRCGMKLVPGDPWNEREYLLDVKLSPATPTPGARTRFRLTVIHPESRTPVRDFAVVHDKQFHLFVVSQDLEDFAHIHPEQDEDGAWTIDHTLARPGYYRIYADFLPIGGTPQVLGRTLATAAHDGDLSTAVPALRPDTALVKNAGTTRVQLTVLPTSPIIAGRTVKLQYQLTEGGTPVTDLEPYLGAWGHTLVLSEDSLEYVHAHPLEYLPANVTDIKGGPTVTFDATFPKPGRYRLWTQFKRRGEVSTTSFTVEAVAAPQVP